MVGSIEAYKGVVSEAVAETAQAFHLRATTSQGTNLSVPCTYQILEPGFRPYRHGKASAEELQARFDEIVAESIDRGVDLGIEKDDSVTKLALQEGLGIDCSNFASRGLTLIHERLALPSYLGSVQRPAEEIRTLHREKPSWQAKDPNGANRTMSLEEAKHLNTNDWLNVDWICEVFGKEPQYALGSKHIANEQSAVRVEAEEMLPGDVVAFNQADSGEVSHVGVVSTVHVTEETVFFDFWHSWHTRDFQSGLRRELCDVQLGRNGVTSWSHEGLGDKSRYGSYFFARPVLMQQLVSSIAD